MLSGILESEIGRIVLSILLGLGLAAVFRKVCKDNNCVVVKGPSTSDLEKYYYKIDDDCFKYTPVATKCKEE
jgi:hypothetical protein